jgi:hypothetical protein
MCVAARRVEDCALLPRTAPTRGGAQARRPDADARARARGGRATRHTLRQGSGWAVGGLKEPHRWQVCGRRMRQPGKRGAMQRRRRHAAPRQAAADVGPPAPDGGAAHVPGEGLCGVCHFERAGHHCALERQAGETAGPLLCRRAQRPLRRGPHVPASSVRCVGVRCLVQVDDVLVPAKGFDAEWRGCSGAVAAACMPGGATSVRWGALGAARLWAKASFESCRGVLRALGRVCRELIRGSTPSALGARGACRAPAVRRRGARARAGK